MTVPERPGDQLEIYKLAVEMADRVSARRAIANSFFVTVNGALAALIGVAGSARKSVPSTFDPLGLVVTAFAGITLSVTWWLILRYYRRLNRAKFEVITEMEKDLPAKPYTHEWALLQPEQRTEEVTRKGIRRLWQRKHREATVVEQVVPWVFVCVYVFLGVAVWIR